MHECLNLLIDLSLRIWILVKKIEVPLDDDISILLDVTLLLVRLVQRLVFAKVGIGVAAGVRVGFRREVFFEVAGFVRVMERFAGI
jgi:hypothetical protein